MMRTSRLDHILDQAIMGLNVDLTPKPVEKSTTINGPVLLPQDTLNIKNMMATLEGPPHFNYVPIQNNMNKMAPEYENVNKITNSEQMLYNAMKPVGKGTTVFNPFNLRSC